MKDKTKWVLDPVHSEILFKVKHLMITNVKGEFRNFQAEIISDENTFSNSKINLTIDAASIFTNSNDRDAHLKNADFFDVEKYKELKPDLTFLDLTMPVMNGFQALEEILKFDQKALVIILTADVQIKAVAKAHDLGAFSVLKKPPAREAIAAAIKEADDALSERG